MMHLGNFKGGMRPVAMRGLYAGAIWTIFTWGMELYNWQGLDAELVAMNRVEY